MTGRELQAFSDEADGGTDGTVLGETKQMLALVLNEMQKLKLMGSVHAGAGEALGTLARMYPQISGAGADMPDGTEMTSRLLHFSASQAASLGDAERVVAGIADPDDPGVAVSAVNAFRDVHASLPDGAMPSAAAREGQSCAMVDLSDRLVAAEEAWFEAQGA